MIVKLVFTQVSKLFRNVPIVNLLEMSLFCVVVFSLECALKRTPVVRAKRNCVFQQAALRSPFGAQGELALAVRRALPGWCRPEPIRNRCKMRHSRTRPQ